jgi:hypothetical protein
VTDEVGVVSDLFFSAEEVQSLFRRRSNSSGEEEFAFSITADRNFGQFRRTNRIKAGMITSALTTTDSAGSQALMTQASKLASSGSAWPPLVQVSQIQWQMRYRESLFEFELIDDPESGFAVVHGWKSDASGQRNLTPLATERPMDEYQFDPLNEEWVPRSR